MQSVVSRYEQLKDYIKRVTDSGLCIAFSGGADSTLLLKAACDAAEKKSGNVRAVTFSTRLHPQSDVDEAKKLALSLGAVHSVIEVNEFADPEIMKNPADRCYRCKKALFGALLTYAREKGLSHIADGTNADDLNQYRPGLRALRELGVLSPLAECGFTKKEVRELSHALGLRTAEKPSAPCLATRIPYNTALNPDVLKRIADGESFLKELGFSVVRIRLHGDIARIEISREKFEDLLQNADRITEELKKLGFLYITLDLEGFRSGSMDQKIMAESAGKQGIDE